MKRLAIVASHPIQYHAPLYRALARDPDIDLHVYFCGRWGLESYHDDGFGAQIAWDVPLTDGYAHTFLPNVSPRPGLYGPAGAMNPGIVRPILAGRHDAVLVNGWGLGTNWLAWASAAARNVPLFLRGESNGLREPTGIRGWGKRRAVGAFLRGVDACLALGTLNRRFYLEHGVRPERIFHVPYAVDNAYFAARAVELVPQRATLKETLGLPIDQPAILFCGKYVENKRPLDLLDAYAGSSLKDEASLIFLGDGPLRSEMERRIAGAGLAHVRLTGFRNQTELPRFYAAADLFALPSTFEPWGLVLNEAACFGLPLVASDQVGAAHDLVVPGVTGEIHPARDVAALARSLEGLVRDDVLRMRMGEAARKHVSGWSYEEDVRGVRAALEAVA